MKIEKSNAKTLHQSGTCRSHHRQGPPCFLTRFRSLSAACALALVLLCILTRTALGAVTLIVGQNVNISRAGGNQTEETIAINPLNPNNLFASETLGNLSRFSTDGGLTWNNSNLAALGGSQGDVATAWDNFGNLFIVRFGVNCAPMAGCDIVVGVSTDGGANFNAPLFQVATKPNDQPSIAVGPGGGIAAGSVWIVYTDTANNIAAHGAAVTGLGAVGAFSAAQIAPGPKGDFGDIAIGPNGEVLVAYQNNGSGNGPDAINLSLDADGLGAGGFVALASPTATQVGGFSPIPAQPTRTIDAEAGLAWDRTGGAHNGRLYLVYLDRPNTASADTDVFVRFSDDNGANWSGPVRVNDDALGNGKSQFLPRIALDQTTGNIGVSFYDCRNSAANNAAQVFASVSTDGGATFLPNVQVSAGTSSGIAAGATGFNFGDYAGLTFHRGFLYPCWADNSNSTGDNPDGALNTMDIYTARVNVTTPPIAKCKDITVSTDAGLCSAAVSPNQVDNGSSDPDGDPITLTLSPASPYPLGKTTVTLTVTDDHAATDSCTATITVVDNEAPVLTCPGNFTVGNDTGQCSAVVTYVAAATDNCGIATFGCNPLSGSTFPKGATPVTCTAADTSGNSASCSFTVTVLDVEAPRVAVVPTTNPAAKKIPTAGKNSKSGQNPDGFYQVLARDNCDPKPKIYVKDSASTFVAGPFKSGDKVKIIQAKGAKPNQKPGAGATLAQITLKGDALVCASDADGNVSGNVNANVPPPPK